MQGPWIGKLPSAPGAQAKDAHTNVAGGSTNVTQGDAKTNKINIAPETTNDDMVQVAYTDPHTGEISYANEHATGHQVDFQTTHDAHAYNSEYVNNHQVDFASAFTAAEHNTELDESNSFVIAPSYEEQQGYPAQSVPDNSVMQPFTLMGGNNYAKEAGSAQSANQANKSDQSIASWKRQTDLQDIDSYAKPAAGTGTPIQGHPASGQGAENMVDGKPQFKPKYEEEEPLDDEPRTAPNDVGLGLPINVKNKGHKTSEPPKYDKDKPAEGVSKLTAALGRAAQSNPPKAPVAAPNSGQNTGTNLQESLQQNMGALQQGGRVKKSEDENESETKRALDEMTGKRPEQRGDDNTSV